MQNANTGGLNATADRDLPQLQKVFKSSHDTANPGPCQIGHNPFFQRPEPMSLAGSADVGQPPVLGRFQCDARSDRFNRSLETFKVAFWPEPDDTPTIRAPIKLKQQGPLVSIKNGFGKTMSPKAVTVAAWAAARLPPRVISLLFEKFLEFDSKKHYHFTVPCGPWQAHGFAGAAVCKFRVAALAFLNKKGLIPETYLFW